MKNLICLAAAVLSISLIGCGNKEEEGATTGSEPTTTSTTGGGATSSTAPGGATAKAPVSTAEATPGPGAAGADSRAGSKSGG